MGPPLAARTRALLASQAVSDLTFKLQLIIPFLRLVSVPAVAGVTLQKTSLTVWGARYVFGI